MAEQGREVLRIGKNSGASRQVGHRSDPDGRSARRADAASMPPLHLGIFERRRGVVTKEPASREDLSLDRIARDERGGHCRSAKAHARRSTCFIEAPAPEPQRPVSARKRSSLSARAESGHPHTGPRLPRRDQRGQAARDAAVVRRVQIIERARLGRVLHSDRGHLTVPLGAARPALRARRRPHPRQVAATARC
jgi:hypothetical protein